MLNPESHASSPGKNSFPLISGTHHSLHKSLASETALAQRSLFSSPLGQSPQLIQCLIESYFFGPKTFLNFVNRQQDFSLKEQTGYKLKFFITEPLQIRAALSHVSRVSVAVYSTIIRYITFWNFCFKSMYGITCATCHVNYMGQNFRSLKKCYSEHIYVLNNNPHSTQHTLFTLYNMHMNSDPYQIL